MKYVIIPVGEVSNVDFSQVLETSVDTLRHSLDRSQVLLKFEGDTPSFLNGKQTYNYNEIMEILWASDWTEPE